MGGFSGPERLGLDGTRGLFGSAGLASLLAVGLVFGCPAALVSL
jgi:hypothetical protein